MPEPKLPTWGQREQKELERLREEQSGFRQQELHIEPPPEPEIEDNGGFGVEIPINRNPGEDDGTTRIYFDGEKK